VTRSNDPPTENALYDYWPISARPPLRLPNGARMAFWLGLNVEHFRMDMPGTAVLPKTMNNVPDPLNFGWRDYGNRVGVWRMIELFDRYGIRPSVLLNSDVCSRYPDIIEAGRVRDWTWLAHGRTNSVMQQSMPEEEERAFLTDVVQTIEAATGRRPRGWLGPTLSETFATPHLLAELGLDYILDWCSDDQPFPLNVRSGRMISVPYSVEINDIIQFLGRGVSPHDFADMVIDQFDTLYEEGATTGRIMAISTHTYLLGQPFRRPHLERVLKHVTSRADVWLPTSDEIATWYYDQVYAEATQALAERQRTQERPR
jgi:allantoinase